MILGLSSLAFAAVSGSTAGVAVAAGSTPPLPTVAPTAAPTPGSGGLHVYTNADLRALEPIPTQAAPLAEGPTWDFVLKLLDRERELEERRMDREIALREFAARLTPPEEPIRYGYPLTFYPGFSCGGTCGGACGGGTVLRFPSNQSLSLQARGIRTAVDLYRESLADTRIRREALP